MFDFKEIEAVDKEIAEAVLKETKRQQDNIELIASENFVSKAVMAAMGTTLTNKYAEGYPSKRYYGGCECVDIVENLARDRARRLFGADHVNVQPHSGSQANQGVYVSILNPGDKVMGMNLSHGGHLTHGSPVNLSGKLYDFVAYGVGEGSETIDYDKFYETAMAEKPKLIIAGGSAYPRAIDFKRIGEIAKEAGAYYMVDMAHIAGLVAVGLHESPVPYADFVTSTTHKTLRGPRGGMIICKEQYAAMIDKAIFPGIQGGPLMHIIAAKAVCFKEALDESFKLYQMQIIKNAKALAEALKAHGFKLVSDGTDTHLILINLSNKNVTGKDAERMLDEVMVTCNKNTVPFETLSPFVTSGIRLGTPAVTSRGMVEEDMEVIADIINLTLSNFEENKGRAMEMVAGLTRKYPLYASN